MRSGTIRLWRVPASPAVPVPLLNGAGIISCLGAQLDTVSQRRPVPHDFKRRILIVDDDAALLATTAAALSREGYEVMTATDGFAALAVLRGGMPDVLISDLKMPNMSGFELLAIVRKRFPAIAVI